MTRATNRHLRTAAALALVLFTGLGAGCVAPEGLARNYLPGGERPAAGLHLAVVPLENLTDYPNAGRIVAELLTTELYKAEAFRVLETSTLQHRLEKERIDADRLAESTAAADLGQRLGVDAVLLGSVTEYGYQHGLREEPAVGISVRLVRSGDGAVLWAASHSETGGGTLARESLVGAAQRVAIRMVEALVHQADGAQP